MNSLCLPTCGWLVVVGCLLIPSVPLVAGDIPRTIELAYAEAESPTRVEMRVRFETNGQVQAVVTESGERHGTLLPRDFRDQICRELWEECQLLQLESDDIARRLDAAAAESGLAWRLSGAAETVITLIQRGERREIRCRALSLNARRFSTVEAVQRLHQAERRLLNLAAIAQAGGVPQVEGYLNAANQSCRQQSEKCPELTVADLSVFQLSDGFRYLQFQRELQSAEADVKLRPAVVVSIIDRPGSPHEVLTLVTPRPPNP